MIIYIIEENIAKTTLIFINHLKRASFYLSVENSLKKTLISLSKVEQPISFKQIIRRLCITSTYTFLFELYFNFLMKNKVFHLISTTLSYQHNIHFHINIIYKKDYVLVPVFFFLLFFSFSWIGKYVTFKLIWVSYHFFFLLLIQNVIFHLTADVCTQTQKKNIFDI